MSMDIRRRLRKVIDAAGPIGADATPMFGLCQDALTEILRLEQQREAMTQACLEWLRTVSAANEKCIQQLHAILQGDKTNIS